MRPAPELEQKLRDIRLVLMDIDGTLVQSNIETFDQVILQLRRLPSLKITFSIATGRSIAGAMPILRALTSVRAKMPPLITYNGAVMLSGENGIAAKRLLMPRTALTRVVEFCRGARRPLVLYACRDDLTGIKEAVYSERGANSDINGATVNVVPDLLRVDDDFVAGLIETKDFAEAQRVVQELMPVLGEHARVSSSGGRFVEICHFDGTKLGAMKWLASHCRIELRQIMAIGDNLNDMEMLRNAGVGVAVSNAPEAVRSAANFVCARPAAEGVVEALRALVRSVRNDRKLPAAREADLHDRRSDQSGNQ